MKLKSSLLALFLLLGALSLRADFSECAAQCELQFARDAANSQMSLWDNIWTGMSDTAQMAADAATTAAATSTGSFAAGVAQTISDAYNMEQDYNEIRDGKNKQEEYVKIYHNCIQACKDEE